MLVEKGKNITGKDYRLIVLEKPKTYQKRRPVTGFKHICLLHGNGPAHASEIVTVFLKKGKVTILLHLLHSLNLAPCDFFMFLKLNNSLLGGNTSYFIEPFVFEEHVLFRFLTFCDFRPSGS